MKKKMIVLGALVMAVVLTGYSVSGTYAKYTSKFDLADEARVAKWGFQLNDAEATDSEINIDLFKASYEAKDDATKTDVAAGVKVVAPGTKGEYTFTLTGETETNYTVALSAVVTNGIKMEGYDPIFFRVDGGSWVNADQLSTELAKLYDGKVYAAGTHSDKTHKIEWMWAFDTNDKENTSDASWDVLPTFTTDDVKDTQLAQAQGNITVKISLTVTQSELAATSTEVTPPVTGGDTEEPGA